MKVFISWSGNLSNRIAVLLRDWIPNVLQSVKPYVSSEDIDKGSRWNQDIAHKLAESDYGILCVTKDNIEAPWLNFEAGALSNNLGSSKVCPLLYNLETSEVFGPFRQFQMAVFVRRDFLKLIQAMNKLCGDAKIDDSRVDIIFDHWWPLLESKIIDIHPESIDTSSKNLGNVNSDEVLVSSESLTEKIKTSKNLLKKTLFEFITEARTYRFEELTWISMYYFTDKHSTTFYNITVKFMEILPDKLTDDLLSIVAEMRVIASHAKNYNSMDKGRSERLLEQVQFMYQNLDKYFIN